MEKNRAGLQVSVIIPSYNASDTLPDTLKSVLRELGPSDEVIVVDDGSSDNTAETLGVFKDDRLRYIHQLNSGGPASPRNTGIQNSRGDLILLFDSDDVMLPGKVAAFIEAYESNPDAGMIFSNFRTIDEAGDVLQKRFLDSYELIKNLQLTVSPFYRIEVPAACRYLARENFVGTSGVGIPSEVFRIVGGFDEKLTNGDDRDLWFRITREFPVVYIPDEYHCYRIRSNSISMGSVAKRAWSKLEVLERQLENPIDDRFEMDIRKLMAENYQALAYEAFVMGEMKLSRRYITSALLFHKKSTYIALYAKTLLGRDKVEWLKEIKRRIQPE